MKKKEKKDASAFRIIRKKNARKISKGREAAGEGKSLDPIKPISMDQPFDYEEVVSVTGPAYVQNLQNSDLSFPFYEEVKKNAAGFRLIEEQCVWMRAGIINFRLCDNEYDCYHCAFDQSMRHAMESKSSAQGRDSDGWRWAEQMRNRYEYTARPCIHFLTGQIESPADCSKNYHCDRCPVHQGVSGEKPAAVVGAPEQRLASGYRFADGCYYHFGHSWARLERYGHARVGMDDFSARVFGASRQLQLPPGGTHLQQGRIGWTMSQKGEQAPVQSPLTGKVLEVNPRVLEDPRIVHDDPYGEGWLFLMAPYFLEDELRCLYFGEDCLKWLEKENQRLLELLGPNYEGLAATGGKPLDDLFGHFPEIGWERLVRTFLRLGKKG